MRKPGSKVDERLFWIGMALVLSYLASLLFHRFGPAEESQKSKRKETPMQSFFVRIQPAISAKASARLAALGSVGGGSFSLTLAELRLMLKGISLWWYLVALGLWIASLATPLNISRGILVAVWIWPLLAIVECVSSSKTAAERIERTKKDSIRVYW